MEHLSITFPDDLRKELDEEAKLEHTKRSTLIQKAVRLYLALKRKRVQNDLLREEYQALYGESKKLMKEFEALDAEAWKYVD